MSESQLHRAGSAFCRCFVASRSWCCKWRYIFSSSRRSRALKTLFACPEGTRSKPWKLTSVSFGLCPDVDMWYIGTGRCTRKWQRNTICHSSRKN